MNAQPTGIELTTKYFILNFLIVIFPLAVTIDGKETKGSWGTSFYPTDAGMHSVAVAYKLYWFIPIKSAMSVTVPEGGRARLQYHVSWFWLLSKLTALPG